jgi:H+-translocating NAD(P) transhydrogenase subunit alpha
VILTGAFRIKKGGADIPGTGTLHGGPKVPDPKADPYSMIAGVVKETFPRERRVALVPGLLPSLAKAGIGIAVENGAGEAAGFTDAAYRDKGAQTDLSRAAVFASSSVILQVRAGGANREAGLADLDLYRPGQALIGFTDPLADPEIIRKIAARGVTIFSLEFMPRITRAQGMDALSSMATVAGYKAVILAAATLPRMFPMLMTAAGTITPARVFVIGAGVAGLQAIATAKRLGAVVEAYDIRAAVKEQVESLGAKFVEIPLPAEEAEAAGGYARALGEEFYRRQREMMTRTVAGSNIVITTAQVPGKRAPLLVTREMVLGMAPGSLVVDLAAEQGGNCELTRAGEPVVERGVTVLGPVNLPSTVPEHASQLYGKNVANFLLHLVKDGALRFDADDEIIRDTLVARDGGIVHPSVKDAAGTGAPAPGEGREG